jgi:hypothetical protein
MKKLIFDSPAKAQEAADMCNQLGTNSNLQLEVKGRSVLFIGTQPSETLIMLLRNRWGFEFAEEETTLFIDNNVRSKNPANMTGDGSKKVKRGCFIIAGSLLIVISVFGFLALLINIDAFPKPFFAAIFYLVFLIGGLLLIGVRFGKLIGKIQSRKSEILKAGISTIDVSEKPIIGPGNIVAEAEKNMERFFKPEFIEQPETRMYNSEPSFASVLTPYNNRQYRTAIEEGERLMDKFPDFDTLYSWIGGAYRELSMFEKSRDILLDGLNKSKRKCGLLIDLAEIAWRLNSMDDAIYYLSQGLCCTIKFEEYKIYLLLHYIAKGMGLENEALSFLRQVDNLRAGQIRYIASEANQIMSVAGKMVNARNKQIIIELNKRYLNN